MEYYSADGKIIRKSLNGTPQKYTCEEYPYSYSRYAIWDSGDWSNSDKNAYTDRLRSWYPDTFDALKDEILGRGDYFSRFEPEQIEKFLCELFGEKVKLTGIEEECNAFSGYPYWLLWFRKV